MDEEKIKLLKLALIMSETEMDKVYQTDYCNMVEELAKILGLENITIRFKCK